MERLQKYMAACGVASRRKCEALIEAGDVQVNGQTVTELGYKIDPMTDRVCVNGVEISTPDKIYVLLHKPRGYITTVEDTHDRKTVIDLLTDVNDRVYPVGRLDCNTSGLLLLTNDGQLTNKMTHPSFELDKVYVATVKGIVSDESLKQLESGIMLEDGMTSPAKVKRIKEQEGNSVIEITIHEGRNRQVRRMFEAVGHTVVKLRREKIGFLTLRNLGSGMYRHLEPKEVQKLKQVLGYRED